MPISYKNKIYTTLGTPTVLSGNVVSTTDSAGVQAKDYTVKGKTIVWNQLFNKNSIPNRNSTAITYSVDGNINILTTTNVITTSFFNFLCPTVSGNKYMICAKSLEWNSPIHSNLFIGDSANPDTASYATLTPSDLAKTFTATNETCYIKSYISYSAGNYEFKMNGLQLFDLTKMFGAGNEPATVAEFRAMFPDDYYPYNAGELKTIIPTSVEASGINLLNLVGRKEISSDTVGYRTPTDAYPEIDTYVYYRGVSANGYLSSENVVEATVLSSSVIAKTGTNPGSNGYGVGIPLTVVPSTTYYIKCTTSGVISVGYANSNKIITKFTGELSGPNITITTPGDCRYILVVFRPNALDTLATFENICVSTVQTNEYQPYKKYRADIPSSKYFPDGMRSAGSAYDEINFLSQKAIKRVGVRPYQAGDENNTGFITDKKNTVYALSTLVETEITPPLQALPTYKGFTSFSAPNSLTQNGPLSVTYYAEGGANPESGWLTSYKRKLYMGRNIEWNQLLDKSKYQATKTIAGVNIKNNGDGTYTLNGTYTGSGSNWFAFYNDNDLSIAKRLYGHKVLYGFKLSTNSKLENNSCGMSYEINGNVVNGTGFYNDNSCVISRTLNKVSPSDVTRSVFYILLTAPSSGTAVYKDLIIRPQLFDLTQMFGAGNEPATPEEFWSYFDHKLYPYNPGETQPLFKISRKSQWGALPKHYTARWDKVNSAMVRLNDAASFSTDVTNFAYRGSVNANYSNPFDNIYPWSEIKLCNISIDLYRNLAAGDSITKCVTAWGGDANFSYNDANGVWRYRPEFWGKSWEDDTYRYFDVADKNVYESSYVHYPEAIVGRWHGRNETLTIGGAEKNCLIPSVGMPAKRIAMSTLHTYAKNYGATIDSIYSIDADTLLCVVEFATMNTQNAIGEGVFNLYRQSSDLIQEDATNSTTVKVLAAAGSAYCIPGAIFDIGTSNGGTQVGSFVVISATPNVGDAQYLDVTLDQAVTVTGANYWSVHGLVNVADEAIGSKSGYIGTNGKCNAYYRGIVMFGNMWFYILGAYENKDDHHIWIANSDEEADNYDALDTTVHYDTGLVLPTAGGYTKKLGLLSRSGLLSIPVFCVETGGDSSNPVGDCFYNGVYTRNTVLLRGGSAYAGSDGGAFYGAWSLAASAGDWSLSARPRLKNP